MPKPKQLHLNINEEKLKSVLDKVSERIPDKPKPGLTLKEVILQSKSVIRQALKRGYTYDEIAVIFTEEGIPVKGATIKQYLSEASRTRRSTKSKVATGATGNRQPESQSESQPDTEQKPETLPEAQVETPVETNTKPASTSSKSQTRKSVVKGKFAELPNNDEL